MKFSNTKAIRNRLLTALAVAAVSVAGMSGIAEAATCTSCHAERGQTTDIRPVDSTYRNITTGGFKGSHRKHIDTATSAPADCTSCHGPAVTSYTTSHRNGFINVTSATSVGYSKGTHFPQSGSPTLGTCSAASCHDNGKGVLVTTPTWGAAAVPACTACHALVPGDSHPAHVTDTSNKKAVCADCHKGTVQGVSANATDHRDGNIDVYKNTAGDLGYPANKAKGSEFATCATTYCHSSGQSDNGLSATPVYQTPPPAWGGSISCGDCHTTSTRTTGSHTKHFASSTNCGNCHTGAEDGSYSSTRHVDGFINVSGVKYSKGSASTPGTGYGTCSAASCHVSPYGTALVTTTAWGTTGSNCATCHNGSGAFSSYSAPATGSHAIHRGLSGSACNQCHAGAVAGSNGGTGHLNDVINVSNGYPATAKHAAGTYTGTCSTSVCHGSSSPVWGANTTNVDLCTKCHGTATQTVTSANRYVVAPSTPAGTDTGNVSSNAKTGAHQTHLLYSNGFSNYSTVDYRCEGCHGTLPTSGLHANGSSTPAFQGLATKGGYVTSYNSGTCSVYCHNPAGTNGTLASGNAGTGVSPLWTNAGYIADGTAKTDTNCNVCHKSPGNGSFTSSTDHSALTIANDCSGCHGHNGGIGGAAGQRHMDGVLYGNGSCDICHGYPPMTQAQLDARTGGAFANAKLEDYTSGGGGKHSKHLLSTITAADGFAPCLPCHPSTKHNQGGGVVAKANVNVNDAADLTYRFDDERSKRYNTATRSCANVSCHFQPTATW